MNTTSKQLYASLAALAATVIYLAFVALAPSNMLPTWAQSALTVLGCILCAVFSYLVIVRCGRLTQEKNHKAN